MKKPVAPSVAGDWRSAVRKPGGLDARRTDNFTCPECGHEDDINGFLFLQPCGFSNLGFIFNNWLEAGFEQEFLDEFADWLDQPVSWVRVEL